MIILCTAPRPFWKWIVLVILFFYKDNSASGKPAYVARILMSVALTHTYLSIHVNSSRTHTIMHKPSKFCRNKLEFLYVQQTALYLFISFFLFLCH